MGFACEGMDTFMQETDVSMHGWRGACIQLILSLRQWSSFSVELHHTTYMHAAALIVFSFRIMSGIWGWLHGEESVIRGVFTRREVICHLFHYSNKHERNFLSIGNRGSFSINTWSNTHEHVQFPCNSYRSYGTGFGMSSVTSSNFQGSCAVQVLSSTTWLTKSDVPY